MRYYTRFLYPNMCNSEIVHRKSMTMLDILQIFQVFFSSFFEKTIFCTVFRPKLSDKNDTKVRALFATPKVRKILTFQFFKLERCDRFVFRKK